jgi:Flp pilus assembly pilin Flp
MHTRSSTLCAAADGKVQDTICYPTAVQNRWNFTGSLEIPRSVADMITMVRRFRNDKTAATAIECGFIAAGISLAIIAIGLGTNLTPSSP